MAHRRSFSVIVGVAVIAAAAGWFYAEVFPRWFPQWSGRPAWGVLPTADLRPLPPTLADLPLVQVDGGNPHGPVAIFFTGNMGWWNIDEGMATGFRLAGVTTIGWNSVGYFVQRRTPEGTATDLARVIDTIAPERPILLVGYSFGADVVATAYGLLDSQERARIKIVSMLGLSRRADYAIGFWHAFVHGQRTVTAIAQIDGPIVQCFRGIDEGSRSACGELDPHRVTIIDVPGGHHFDGDYVGLARRIVAALPAATHAPPTTARSLSHILAIGSTSLP